MNEKELNFILQEGEGLKIEFKESFDAKSLAKEIVAFANAKGGKIFLGVNDKGEAKGIGITNKIKSQIQDIARNCDPKLNISLKEFNKILIIEVQEGMDKPYKCSKGFYLREGASSQKLSRNELLGFVTGLGRIRFDQQISDSFNFPKDFDKERFDEFLKKSNILSKSPVKEVITNLSLGGYVNKKFRLNNAGVLLFGKDIKKFFRQNLVTCVLYKGRERTDIIDRKDFENDLLTNYEDVIKFLKQHLKLEYVIKGTGPRKEVLELPEEALRESVLNALMHRDYFDERFGIFVEIFDDRVEITNKGKLLFDKKKLGKISLSRNPIIFDAFYRLGLIEKVGSGINRVKNLVKKRGLKVKFEIDDFFRVKLYRPATQPQKIVPLNAPLNVPLNKRQETVLQIIASEKTNTNLLAERLHVSRKTVQRDISYLVISELVKRIGPKKTGYYSLTDELKKKITKKED